MVYSKGNDVQPPYIGGLTPGRRLLLTPGYIDMLDYDETPLTPPYTVFTARADNYHRVVASPSSIQLARERLRRSFEGTEAVNRVDSVMASCNRFQARTGGSESVIKSCNYWQIAPNYVVSEPLFLCKKLCLPLTLNMTVIIGQLKSSNYWQIAANVTFTVWYLSLGDLYRKLCLYTTETEHDSTLYWSLAVDGR